MEDELALNQFIDDNAFDAFVDAIGDAMGGDVGTDAGSSDLLVTVMDDHLADPAKKADFVVDIMQKDEML